MKYYVYILTTTHNKMLYVGVTDNLARRVYEHKQGLHEGFTKRFNISKLVYAEAFDDIRFAIKREKQIKSFRREKKEALINSANPSWEELAPI